MKGKKFNAAEKHFKKKEERYRKEIAHLEDYVKAQKHQLVSYEDRIQKLEYENHQQKEWIGRLLQYTELSLDDIKKACEKDKEIASLVKSINLFQGIGTGSYL